MSTDMVCWACHYPVATAVRNCQHLCVPTIATLFYQAPRHITTMSHERHGVSNNRPLEYLLNSLFVLITKETSTCHRWFPLTNTVVMPNETWKMCPSLTNYDHGQYWHLTTPCSPQPHTVTWTSRSGALECSCRLRNILLQPHAH